MSTTTLMTFAEFEQLPPMAGKQELINGELVRMPPADKGHSLITTRIAGLLWDSPVRDRMRVDHTGYRMGSAGWVEPDASVLWPDQPQDDKYLLRAPMLAVEILSPGERIELKLTLYFAEGALEVWVIDPKRQTMSVYSRRRDEIVRLDVQHEYYCELAQVTVRLAELFA